jgi:hypothetical protein
MKPAKIYNCEMSSDAKSDPLVEERWTPAQVGRALKIVLYVGVAAAFWVLNQYFGGNTTAEDRDVVGGPHAPGPTAADDFSPWEPEP